MLLQGSLSSIQSSLQGSSQGSLQSSIPVETCRNADCLRRRCSDDGPREALSVLPPRGPLAALRGGRWQGTKSSRSSGACQLRRAAALQSKAFNAAGGALGARQAAWPRPLRLQRRPTVRRCSLIGRGARRGCGEHHGLAAKRWRLAEDFERWCLFHSWGARWLRHDGAVDQGRCAVCPWKRRRPCRPWRLMWARWCALSISRATGSTPP